MRDIHYQNLLLTTNHSLEDRWGTHSTKYIDETKLAAVGFLGKELKDVGTEGKCR